MARRSPTISIRPGRSMRWSRAACSGSTSAISKSASTSSWPSSPARDRTTSTTPAAPPWSSRRTSAPSTSSSPSPTIRRSCSPSSGSRTRSKGLVRSACLCVLAVVTLLAAAAPAAARLRDPEALPEVRIQDLPYGDVLFYYYQGKDFETATRLLAYEHWQGLPHHEADAHLLLGGLYLSLGMYDRANRTFEQLLTSDVPTGVRDRAWLYLGQALY